MQETVSRIINRIPEKASGEKSPRPFLIAIDGRCAAGKSTLAAMVGQRLNCSVFHTDDFFLQPYQRTEERLSEPGGNMDRERFAEEILKPLSKGKNVLYRPFDCHTMGFSDPVEVTVWQTAVIEGSYSCHPELWDFYDMHIFLNVSAEEQLRRIENRNGANLEMFRNKWIPLEERYFREFGIMEKCGLVFEMDGRTL
ncbi:MAG: (d)CMP kinase [Ruminiclostridium sp.]|nr:(d)CMP kinase [Ruminiclostridium sp.]